MRSVKTSKVRDFDPTDLSDQPDSSEFCPMCGALRIETGETDRADQHNESEIIHKLAQYMQEDWKACCILLLYIAMPNQPVRIVSKHIVLSIGAICEARQRAAERFPQLSGVLGLLTPDALAKQARFKKEKEASPQGNLF